MEDECEYHYTPEEVAAFTTYTSKCHFEDTDNLRDIIAKLALDLQESNRLANRLVAEIDWVSDSMPTDWNDLLEGMPEDY